MNRDLLLALFAHDAYERGYQPDLPRVTQEKGKGLANFELLYDSSDPDIEPLLSALDDTVGFYAVAYEAQSDGNGFQAGDIVISYRGTDPDEGGLIPDVLNGWTTGTGFSDQAQANLAAEFYEAV